jgi:hypothetical protein
VVAAAARDGTRLEKERGMRRAALLLSVLAASRPAVASSDVPPPSSAPKLDLLVVVDTSAAAAPLRASLAGDVGPFLDELGSGASNGQLDLDLHVGVITADPADGGALRPAAVDCAAAPSLPYLAYTLNDDGSTTTNYTGRLADAMTCLLPPATATGADVAQPFATLTAAVGGALAAGAGFRRPDAILAILVITDQDDCSPLNGAPPDRLQCAEIGWSCSPALDDQRGPRTGCIAIGEPQGLVSVGAAQQAIGAVAPGAIVFGVLGGDGAPVAVADGPALAPSCGRAAITATPSLRLETLAALFPASWLGSACGVTGFADFGHVIADTLWPPQPPAYDCDGGFGPPLADGRVDGCGCRGSRPSAGGLVLVALSILGVARRSAPSRRCTARRARAAG